MEDARAEGPLTPGTRRGASPVGERTRAREVRAGRDVRAGLAPAPGGRLR